MNLHDVSLPDAPHPPATRPDIFTVQKCETQEEWLSYRGRGIGASEAAAVLGLNHWKSPLKVYTDKLGLVDDFVDSAPARAGRLLEPVVAKMYTEDTERHLLDLGRFTILTNIERPFMAATLDRVITGADAAPGTNGHPPHVKFPPLDEARTLEAMQKLGPGVCEIKTAGWRKEEEWQDEPPPAYLVQVQHQMAVTGAQWGSLAVLIGGQQFKWRDIRRNEAFLDQVLYPRLTAFWENVQKGVPPEADGSESSAEALKLLYPTHVPGKTISLPVAALEFHAQKQKAIEEKKMAEAALLAADNGLKGLIEDAEVAVLPGGMGSYKYKVEPRSGATCKDHAAVLECPVCHTPAKGSEPRVLRFSKK